MSFFRPFFLLSGCCLCFVSCAQTRPKAGATSQANLDKSAWYVAQEEPLTFCPKGHALPKCEWGHTVGEYVYLEDRKTRFFVPAGAQHAHFRKQALAVREATLSPEFKRRRKSEKAADLVAEVILRLIVAGLWVYGGAQGESLPVAAGALGAN